MKNYTALAMETVYFKGEVSPYGWAKVPAYPLCGAKAGGSTAPQRPRTFAGQFLVEFCLVFIRVIRGHFSFHRTHVILYFFDFFDFVVKFLIMLCGRFLN
jgi:hypothetical protein